MEDYVLNDRIARPTSQRLQCLSSVCAEDLDYSSALRGRCNQSTVRVHAQCTEFSLVRLDQTVHAVFRH